MAYSPKAITAIYPIVKKSLPSMRVSGVYANKSGYHNSRDGLRSRSTWRNDYSIQTAADKEGDGDAASAIDMSFNTKELNTVCRRLMSASLKKDPRLQGKIREWFGSYDGKRVIGYSLYRGRNASSDASHKWHLHISGFRRYANDEKVWLGIAEVILGLPDGELSGTKVSTAKAYKVDLNEPIYLDRIHRGVTNSDSVAVLQHALKLVFKDQFNIEVNGDFGGITEDAVKEWQRMRKYNPVNGKLGRTGVKTLLDRAGLHNKIYDSVS